MAEFTDALNQADEGTNAVRYYDVLPKITFMDMAMNKLIAMKVDESRQKYESAVASYQRIRIMTFAALGAGMLLAVLMAFFMIRSIVGTLTRAVRVANAIAQGQLGHRTVTRPKDARGHLREAVRLTYDREPP